MAQFNFSFQPGMTLQQMIGFEIAGRIWGSYLTDNTTINLHVGMANLASNVLGGALPGFKAGQNYSEFRNQYRADIRSADDQTTAQTMFLNDHQLQHVYLPSSIEYSSDRVFATHYDQYLDSTFTLNGSTDWFQDVHDGRLIQKDGITYGRWGLGIPSYQMSLTRANAKALALDASMGAGLDGYIVLSNLVNNPGLRWNYDFTRSTAMPSNTLDFLSTALHEIGHVLGFVSGVDRPNLPTPFFKRSDSPDGSLENLWNTEVFNNYWQNLADRSKNSTPLDLTRYSVESTNWQDRSQRGFQDASMGAYYDNLFFSVDGINSLGHFAEGKDTAVGGDGSQASHWKEEATSLGLMDSHIRVGERATLAPLDLRAFDVIGWNLNPNSVNLNYATLLSQAKQSLASRLGRTVSWLDANATLAADWLDQDRLTDVNSMISNSGDIYDGRTNTGTRSWQELFALLEEQGLLDTLGDASPESSGATAQSDLLSGTTLDDELSGLNGNDQILGFAGNDTLRGNRGRDILVGDEGNDYLAGGRGDDLLVGGAGADRFAVQVAMGLDVVKDFTIGEDKLVLPNGLQWQQLSLEQQGQHTAISLDSTPLMLLQNVNASLLSTADVLTAV